MSELNLNRLYNPDGKELGAIIAGLSGSGKTTAVISTLQKAISSSQFGESHRFLIIDPKNQYGDYDILADPIYSLDKVKKSLRKERVTVFYPNISILEAQVENIIDYVFRISDKNPETSFTIVLDEASSLITPTQIPDQVKRMVVQGRAKRIKPVFLSQRPIINRWTDANISSGLFFRILPVDADVLKRRFGIDFESNIISLNEVPYSYIFMDFETAQIKNMTPVDLPKPKPKKKKGRLSRLFGMD